LKELNHEHKYLGVEGIEYWIMTDWLREGSGYFNTKEYKYLDAYK
jgi:hypothetical protein